MLGLLAPTLCAIVVARALGGSPRWLIETRVCGWPLVLVAFGVELLLYNPPIDAQPWALVVGPWIWLVTKLALLAVVGLNLRAGARWPWLLAGLGLALNTLVVAANAGYMPQSSEAAFAVWGARTLDPLRLHNVVPMGSETRLAWLGDVFAEPAWLPRANVLSAGDILLATGIACWAFVISRPSARLLHISWIWSSLHGNARSSRRAPN